MSLARTEVFGPVLGVMTYRDEADAVRLANDCDFGLMANIWTLDGTRALRVARQLRAGRVAINGDGALRPGVPVFGYKLGGIGAEFGFDETITSIPVPNRCSIHSPWRSRRGRSAIAREHPVQGDFAGGGVSGP